jgi:hypothetical protein
VSDRVYTSIDSINWFQGSFAVGGASSVPMSVAVSPQGTLVAASASGIVSFDGTHWWTRCAATNGGYFFVAANSTGLIAVGSYGNVATSPDGITWTQRPSITAGGGTGANVMLRGAAYGSGGWVVVGNADPTPGGTPLVLSSPDGQTFKQHALPAGAVTLNSVVFGNGKYVVSGVGGSNVVSEYVSAVYAPPVSVANAPVLTNPKVVAAPIAPITTAGVHH